MGSFVKFAPLVEPIKYLIGKFDVSDNYINNLPRFDSSRNDVVKNSNEIMDEALSAVTAELVNLDIDYLDYQKK